MDGSYYKGQGIRQGIEREYIMVSDDGSGIDSTECREDRWEDISHSDGKSRNRGGQLPILVLTETGNELSNSDRSLNGKQSPRELLRSGRIQRNVGDG